MLDGRMGWYKLEANVSRAGSRHKGRDILKRQSDREVIVMVDCLPPAATAGSQYSP